MLGTAFQCELSRINSAMVRYDVNGPGTGKMMFYPMNAADNSLVERGSTANGYGHWFDSNCSVCGYDANVCRVFSEFYPISMAFILGQNPGKCKAGETYTIGQAIKYKRNYKQTAVARFIFHINMLPANSSAYTELKRIEYADPTGIEMVESPHQRQDSSVYTLTGTKVADNWNQSSLPKGIYIVNGRKVFMNK
jgi:hypothetical protein